MLKRFSLLITFVTLTVLSSRNLSADTFTQVYNGTLANPTSIFQQSLNLSSSSTLSISSSSYAAGGFQPSLTLYTGSGAYVASQSASSAGAGPDPITGLALDGALMRNAVPAGSYIFVLTNWLYQQPPTAVNLSDGFVNYGGSAFTDVAGNLRTGVYSVTVAVTPVASSQFLNHSRSACFHLGLQLFMFGAGARC